MNWSLVLDFLHPDKKVLLIGLKDTMGVVVFFFYYMINNIPYVLVVLIYTNNN